MCASHHAEAKTGVKKRKKIFAKHMKSTDERIEAFTSHLNSLSEKDAPVPVFISRGDDDLKIDQKFMGRFDNREEAMSVFMECHLLIDDMTSKKKTSIEITAALEKKRVDFGGKRRLKPGVAGGGNANVKIRYKRASFVIGSWRPHIASEKQQQANNLVAMYENIDVRRHDGLNRWEFVDLLKERGLWNNSYPYPPLKMFNRRPTAAAASLAAEVADEVAEEVLQGTHAVDLHVVGV